MLELSTIMTHCQSAFFANANPERFKWYDSPLGIMVACYAPQGLRFLQFLDDIETISALQQTVEAGAPCQTIVQQIENALMHYFRGEPVDFSTLPLAPCGTAFQQQAWQALRAIPYGITWSYQEQARFMKRPTAARAVGNANGKNPLPIVIPCHRVVASHGGLGGYSGGLWRKSALLTLERTREAIPPLAEAEWIRTQWAKISTPKPQVWPLQP